ncbi:hypothetical protein BU24DRAFT_427912 [Aaosphaeria arxii CBS 175.79]|uniref:Serine hydrolase domain-containing protein n=1 Tax=Aaosphaeria arxii CBS 175.79 TaxID=1450172 RepID=A0A6A5XAA4_9PLEO|nr:uncharacterized protein BU24DRAFT_427912 [Aaosphaeria arxii CBS 175.79]KAF2009881.1 hypothetical protein BU24DRAFT_427912 [Aaosphaeria arxii CBS 175.79]
MPASISPPNGRKSTSKIPEKIPDSTNLPRILCLHGGGVNATIFEAQSRSLIRHLQHSFRLVWAEAPFFCDPHPDVIRVYGTYGPFRRWVRWLDQHSEIDSESCIEEIGYSLRTAMEEDDRAGGTGQWVGLMGFSQGAKLSASLLLEQQAREDKAVRERKAGTDTGPIGIPGLDWRFGVLLAGRAPLINLNPDVQKSAALVPAANVAESFEFVKEVDDEAILRNPTIHVHGLADPGLALHRRLLDEYCDKGSTRLIEWDGAHRIAIKGSDVEPIVSCIYDVASEAGIRVVRTV